MKTPSNDSQVMQKHLLQLVHIFLLSLEKKRAADILNLDSKISSDLGIDSLGRVELFHQIEDKFGIYLPENLLAEAETIRDIYNCIEKEDYSKDLNIEAQAQQFTETTINPLHFKTLIEVLLKRGYKEPTRIHIYYQDEKGHSHPITYGELLKNSSKVAANLQAWGFKKGETVAIMLPTCPEFFYTFMGIMLAGLIPVPIYPPFRPDKLEEYALRESIILKNAEVRLMVTFYAVEKLASLLKVFIPNLKRVVTAQKLLEGEEKFVTTGLKGASPAFIQYTSGSTSDPKGVLLSHDNLLANMRAVSQVIQLAPTDIGVSWLPLYHDMGLIGGWLTSFYSAIPVVIMSPLAFLSRPERWLWAIHYYKATLSAAPNFAYELCVKKIQEDKIKGMDLSSWRLSFNGAEAVNPATLERFYKKFAPFGLKNTMIYPAYGLAESTVALILPKPHQEPQVDIIDKEILETEHKAIPVQDPKRQTLSFVSVGSPIPQHQVKIVGDDSNEVPDRTVGRLLFKGPSMMEGYYKNPTATEKIKAEDWLDSGDYAYKDNDSYYITGRRKDLIIKAGRNFYPEEIEQIVSQIAGIRQGCVAAFGATDYTLSTEKLVIVAETKESRKKLHHEIVEEVQEQVTSALGVPPDDIVLVSPGSIPKTSSGKLQRARCKQLYETQRLSAPKVPIWLQFVKLTVRALFYKVKHNFYFISKIFYTFYVLLFTFFYIPILTLLLWITPKVFKRTIAKYAARVGMYGCGMPIIVKNSRNWPHKVPQVYVVNHASYLDAVVLLATLPQNVLLVGKKEITKMPFIGRLAEAVGILTVDRYDFSKNLDDTKKIESSVLEGQAIAIFPEGTFSYVEGLRSFKLGAFRIAVDTGTPICPLVIRGTRKIFRGTQLLFTPGIIEVEIGTSIVPESKDWSEVTRLHSEAKAFIAAYCGEPVVEF